MNHLSEDTLNKRIPTREMRSAIIILDKFGVCGFLTKHLFDRVQEWLKVNATDPMDKIHSSQAKGLIWTESVGPLLHKMFKGS